MLSRVNAHTHTSHTHTHTHTLTRHTLATHINSVLVSVIISCYILAGIVHSQHYLLACSSVYHHDLQCQLILALDVTVLHTHTHHTSAAHTSMIVMVVSCANVICSNRSLKVVDDGSSTDEVVRYTTNEWKSMESSFRPSTGT